MAGGIIGILASVVLIGFGVFGYVDNNENCYIVEVVLGAVGIIASLVALFA